MMQLWLIIVDIDFQPHKFHFLDCLGLDLVKGWYVPIGGLVLQEPTGSLVLFKPIGSLVSYEPIGSLVFQ